MRAVARAFGIPKSTLFAHNKEHVEAVPEKASTARSRAAPAIEAIAAASAGPTPFDAGQAAIRALVMAPPAPSDELQALPPIACPICASPEQHAIGVAVRQGATYSAIVARTGVDGEQLRRHALGCIPDLLAQAGDLAARTSPSVVVVEGGEGTMARVERLLVEAETLVDDAKAVPDVRHRAAALTAAKGVAELLVKMRGEFAEHLAQHLTESPHWKALRDRILDALVVHPAALADVVATLSKGAT